MYKLEPNQENVAEDDKEIMESNTVIVKEKITLCKLKEAMGDCELKIEEQKKYREELKEKIKTIKAIM